MVIFKATILIIHLNHNIKHLIPIVGALIFTSGNGCQWLPQVLFRDKRDIPKHSFIKELKERQREMHAYHKYNPFPFI